jgi:hypothetical protein
MRQVRGCEVNDQWEPLETADAVVAAHAAGRKVEVTAGDCDCQLPSEARGWMRPTHLRSRAQVVAALNAGARYRARGKFGGVA